RPSLCAPRGHRDRGGRERVRRVRLVLPVALTQAIGNLPWTVSARVLITRLGPSTRSIAEGNTGGLMHPIQTPITGSESEIGSPSPYLALVPLFPAFQRPGISLLA